MLHIKWIPYLNNPILTIADLDCTTVTQSTWKSLLVVRTE